MVDLAAVYSRNLNGEILTLAPSGWTYKNTFVLYDHQTRSLWYPENKGLRGISGEHAGQFLKKLKSEDTRWRKWSGKHSRSRIMK